MGYFGVVLFCVLEGEEEHEVGLIGRWGEMSGVGEGEECHQNILYENILIQKRQEKYKQIIRSFQDVEQTEL